MATITLQLIHRDLRQIKRELRDLRAVVEDHRGIADDVVLDVRKSRKIHTHDLIPHERVLHERSEA